MRLNVGGCPTASIGMSTRGGVGRRAGGNCLEPVEGGNCSRVSNQRDEAGTFGEHHFICLCLVSDESLSLRDLLSTGGVLRLRCFSRACSNCWRRH